MKRILPYLVMLVLVVGVVAALFQLHARSTPPQADRGANGRAARPVAVLPPASRAPRASGPDGADRLPMERGVSAAPVFTKESTDQVSSYVVGRAYGYVFDYMNGLPPATVAKLRRLLVERYQARNANHVSSGPVATSDGARTPAMIDREIDALLGDRSDEFRVLEELKHPMELVQSFGGYGIAHDLEFADQPLTSDQRLHLAMALQRSLAKAGGGVAADMNQPADPDSGLKAYQTEFLNAAAAVLSPAQLAIVQENQREWAQRFRSLTTKP